jgi:ribokinase
MADLVVAGSYNAALTVYSATLPAPGETVVGTRFEQGPGGKGANQAIGARRLGADVLFVTRLGADAFGDQARSILLAEGLPAHGITTDDQNPTGIALILVEDSGQNAISVAPGANASLSGPDVLGRFGPDLRGCKYLLMQLECRAELAVDLSSWARDAGCVSILNPAPVRPLPPGALASFDIITPNEGELQTLAASLGLAAGPADVLARQLLSYGVRDVVVTLGERGALWASAAGLRYFDAYPVRAIDTTGAGDAFNAGLAAALVRGEPMESAIDHGCRAGAFCVTRNGVIDGLGLPADLEQLRY